MGNLIRLKRELANLMRGGVLFGPLTSELTSFRIGGPAFALAKPASIDQLKNLIALLHQEEAPFFVLGAGTNLLFPDKGYRGVLIHLGKGFNSIFISSKGCILAGAGARMPKLAFQSINSGFEGLEHLAVIPGTVGGGVVQNAGSGGRELAANLDDIFVFDCQTTKTSVLTRAELKMGYRRSILKFRREFIVLKVRFRLSSGDRDEMLESVKKKIQMRKKKMPLNFPNAGSIFKRPTTGEPPGKLIEEAGCKGLSVGGAVVSEKHANFIVNTGSATCSDVLKLMDIVRERVLTAFQIELEPEIELVNECA